VCTVGKHFTVWEVDNCEVDKWVDDKIFSCERKDLFIREDLYVIISIIN